MTTILAISGSPRAGGNSDLLMERVLAGALEQGIDGEAVYLRDLDFKGCIGCEGCRTAKACVGLADDMQRLYPKIEAARGLVLFSPTHFYTVSSLMKCFIDRLYCYFDFAEPRPGPWESRLAGAGRVAVIGGVCEQPDAVDMGCTIQVMQLSLDSLGYKILGKMAVPGTFAKGKVASKPDALEEAENLGRRLGRTLAKKA